MEDGFKGCVGLVSIALIIVVLVVGGVWRTEVVYTPPGSANLGNQVPFEEDATARHYLAGFIKGKQPDLKQILAKYVREDEQVAELSITTRHTFLDNLLMGVTLFIYSPVTVTIRGKVARVGTRLKTAQ
jgi:hypothetical protein